jgi:hypothetical protein
MWKRSDGGECPMPFEPMTDKPIESFALQYSNVGIVFFHRMNALTITIEFFSHLHEPHIQFNHTFYDSEKNVNHTLVMNTGEHVTRTVELSRFLWDGMIRSGWKRVKRE